jgi:glyoxylate reductase
MRIFATCDIGGDALDRLRERGWEVEVFAGPDPPPRDRIVEAVRSGVDALITTLRDPIDREVFEAGRETLQIVAQNAVGFDNIDREAANELKVPFSNTADVLTEAVAEYTLFLLGDVARKLYPSERMVREGKWRGWHPYLPFLGDEVGGKVLSIVGAGRIGRYVAAKAVGLELDMRIHDIRGPDEAFAGAIQEQLDLRHAQGFTRHRLTIHYDDFDRVLEQGDFVTLHVPLVMPGTNSAPTWHMIGRDELKRMKDTAYLIQTSRGPVVDEEALVEALREGWIAGAALDVFEEEPLPPDSPLRDPALEDRVRLYHHFASGTKETRLSTDPGVGMAGRTVATVIRVLEGESPAGIPWVVNREIFR